MKNILFALLLIGLSVQAQTQKDTIKNAKGWQNTYAPFTTFYGLTREGHPYAVGVNNNYNSAGAALDAELIRVDLVTGQLNSLTLTGVKSTASILWQHVYDSLGNLYIGFNTNGRPLWKFNLKDSIVGEHLGNAFGGNEVSGQNSLVYSNALGTDGHIYFGGSSGNTNWSEFDPIGDTFVHQYTFPPIDDWNDYVQYIAGDSDYVYSQVGERNNTKKLFATNKATNVSTELFHISAAKGFQLETRDNGHVYVSSNADTLLKTFWLYHGQAIKIADCRNCFPVSKRVDYYETGNPGMIRVSTFYDPIQSVLYGSMQPVWGQPFPLPYQAYPIPSDRQPNSVKIIFTDKNDSDAIYFVGNYYGMWFRYNYSTDTAIVLGSTTQNIYCSAQWNDSLFYFGTYPNGTILEWNKNKTWTSKAFDGATITSTTDTTNPKIVGFFRTQTVAQFHHASGVVNMDSFLVFAGNVIRTNNTCSIGGYNPVTHEIWGYNCDKIDRLAATSIVRWNNLVLLSTNNAYGGTPKIYFYNPSKAVNTMVDSIQLSGYTDYGNLFISGDTLIGVIKTGVYKIYLPTKQFLSLFPITVYSSSYLGQGKIGLNVLTNNLPSGNFARYNFYNACPLNNIVYATTYFNDNIVRINGLFNAFSPQTNLQKRRSTFYLYPNPANSYIHIPNGYYFIFSSSGSLILKQQVNNESIDLSRLNSGIYFIRDTHNNTQKLVIQK